MAIPARGGAVASREQMPREGGPWARSLDAVAVVRPLVFSPSLSCPVLSSFFLAGHARSFQLIAQGEKPENYATRNKNVIIPIQKKEKIFLRKKDAKRSCIFMILFCILEFRS